MITDDSAISLVSSPIKTKYCDMVAYFQLWVGIYMFFLCFITLVNTALRFIEISESDRGQFSNEQNKARRDKKEEKLNDAIKTYMNVGSNDV